MEPITLPEQAVVILSEFDLPSGKHVVINEGTGRDQRLAVEMLPSKATGVQVQDAIAARLCLVDGKRIRMEDIDAMSFGDAAILRAHVRAILRPLDDQMEE